LTQVGCIFPTQVSITLFGLCQLNFYLQIHKMEKI
jgi:hypothetical protein